MIATFFRSCRMERSVIIVLAHPRKLNPKPVIEKAENNLIFSFFTDSSCLRNWQHQVPLVKGNKINVQTERLVEYLFQKQLDT